MNNAVLVEARVPGRASRRCLGVTSDPRIGFPYLRKIRASTLGLCAAPLVPGRGRHHSVEGKSHRSEDKASARCISKSWRIATAECFQR
jgi:hypothetical protein